MSNEKPIIFSGEMVRAILDGRKTQTRRVIKFPKHADVSDILSMHQDGGGNWIGWSTTEPHLAEFTKRAYPNGSQGIACPYGKPGDQLWVRETFRLGSSWDDHCNPKILSPHDVYYKADDSFTAGTRWRSPIHMPRNLCRINLEVTNVHAERLQSISDQDCCLELGAPVEWPAPVQSHTNEICAAGFAAAWDKINAGRGYDWDTNPFVWVIEFRRL